MPTDLLLTISEVAHAIQEPLPTVRRWVHKGVLPVEYVGPYKRPRVRLSTLQKLYPPDSLRVVTHAVAQ